MNDRLNRPGDIRSFVAAARSAALVDNWFAAMALALTLPDICAAVDDPGLGKSKPRYVAWWDAYMAGHYLVRPDEGDARPPFTYLPGTEAYALRCSYLHSGTDEVDRAATAMSRIRFLGPVSIPFGYDPDLRTLYIGLEQFVDWVCDAVERWLADRHGDQLTQERLRGLVSIVPASIRLAGRPTQP